MFLLKNSPSQIFFITSVMFWIHPRLDFGLGGFFPFYLDSNQNAFHLEKCLLKIPLKMPYGFWNDPFPLSKISLAMT